MFDILNHDKYFKKYKYYVLDLTAAGKFSALNVRFF